MTRAKSHDVTALLTDFRHFLNASWPVVERTFASSSGDLAGDWFQANWEVLVESEWRDRESQDYLEAYGDGADCNGASSRVWLPNVIPTHRITFSNRDGQHIVNVLENKKINRSTMVFDRFVSWDGKQFAEEAPFDYIQSEVNDCIVIVSCIDVEFFVVKISRASESR